MTQASKNVSAIPKVQQYDFPGNLGGLGPAGGKTSQVTVPVFEIYHVLDNTMSTVWKVTLRLL